jgi:recombination DNA repair RAD52 pathway protein
MTDSIPELPELATFWPKPITQEQLGILMNPLNPARVSSRSQGGRSLSYLEAYDVKATLIRIFGFGGFDSEVIETKVLEINRTEEKDKFDKPFIKVVVLAQVTLRLTIHQTGSVYCETAAASQTGRDVGEVTDFAIKTAASDALKRCAINLGTQFGLSLYNNGSTDEVVRRVFAPGQEWGGQPAPATPEQQGVLARSLGGGLPERDINDDVTQDGGTP